MIPLSWDCKSRKVEWSDQYYLCWYAPISKQRSLLTLGVVLNAYSTAATIQYVEFEWLTRPTSPKWLSYVKTVPRSIYKLWRYEYYCTLVVAIGMTTENLLWRFPCISVPMEYVHCTSWVLWRNIMDVQFVCVSSFI